MVTPGRSFSAGTLYRYGFNGQMKSPELGPDSYTAEFWEYDAATGHRWNTDPVVKPWQSPYATFSGNPIWKVDPDGDDDYFNSNGQLAKQTKTGSKIYVQTAAGNVLLTQVPLSSAINRTAVAKVVGYYATKVGIVHQDVGSTENAGRGFVGLQESPNKSSDENPAFTIGKDVWVNKKGGKINSELYDYNNLESTLIHEKGHNDDNNDPLFRSNLATHVSVYLSQIKDGTFSKGTDKFKSGIVGSFSNYLLNYYARGSNGGTGQLNKYVDDFNKNNKSGFSLQVDVSSNDESDYKMNIYNDKKIFGTINYKKITHEGGDD